eukprot:Phypoly_transcript_10043.p1 GENE.Phypoly_transcript_10043~~Phypoly_transcript_10043.p1  ORF type:complete len:440 (-),score=53.06 Phypoly_transcript_10043:27-1307(-)
MANTNTHLYCGDMQAFPRQELPAPHHIPAPHHTLQGSVAVHDIDSVVLKGNPLGDPSHRKLHVYLPPGYRKGSGPYPTLLALAGLFGDGASFFTGEGDFNLATRMDRLILSYKSIPCIIVAPDCDTVIGGSQYINSPGTGQYMDYIVQEIIPFVRSTYSIPATRKWGVFGLSSGGYGAIMLGMMHPEIFSAVADHSGDGLFDMCFKNIFHEANNTFRHFGGVTKWYNDVYMNEISGGSDVGTGVRGFNSRGSGSSITVHGKGRRPTFGLPIVALGMALIYSPNQHASNGLGCDFPFDLETGEYRHDVWTRWLENDPVHLISKYITNLRTLCLIYLDAGRWDEFNLQHATRNIYHQLERDVMGGRREGGEGGIGVAVGGDERIREGPVVYYEEYDGGHFGCERRFDYSIPMLATALHMQERNTSVLP